jgi:putative flippase GtrA
MTSGPADSAPAEAGRTRDQALRFIVAGLVATGSDALVYAGLLASVDGALRTLAAPAGLDAPDLAKAASFMVGTGVSYLMNKRFTFQTRGFNGRELASFLTLYACTFLLNVGVNHAALLVLGQAALERTVAFVIATGASTVANFVGTKLWVFRR